MAQHAKSVKHCVANAWAPSWKNTCRTVQVLPNIAAKGFSLGIQNKLHSPTEWASWIPSNPKKKLTIHVRRLYCSRAPRAPTESATGSRQCHSLQCSLVYGSGRLFPLPRRARRTKIAECCRPQSVKHTNKTRLCCNFDPSACRIWWRFQFPSRCEGTKCPSCCIPAMSQRNQHLMLRQPTITTPKQFQMPGGGWRSSISNGVPRNPANLCWTCKSTAVWSRTSFGKKRSLQSHFSGP